jgi:TonB family protein
VFAQNGAVPSEPQSAPTSKVATPNSNLVIWVPKEALTGKKTGGKDPVYPLTAKMTHVQGTVHMTAVIDTTGHIEKLQILDGPEMLRQAALDAVKTWTYEPYLVNGMPAKIKTTMEVAFYLSRATGEPAVLMNPRHAIQVSGDIIAATRLTGGDVPFPADVDKKDKSLRRNPVVLQAEISPEGKVTKLTYFSGPQLLAPAAIAAAQQWTYRPYLLRQEPLTVLTKITVNFK